MRGCLPLDMQAEHEKTMEHIKELERELGVPAPKKNTDHFQCGNYV